MVKISLFYCYEEVFTLMNIWMIGKNSMKHHYLKKKRKDFYSKLNMEYITDTDYAHAFAKILYKNFRGLS